MPILISNFKTKFLQYPEDLLSAAAEANLSLPGLTSKTGQALALMGQPGVRGEMYITRKEAEQFYSQIGMDSQDSIQMFNKNTVFKRLNLPKGRYCLEYPFVIDLGKRKRVSIHGDRDACIDMIKKFWRDNLTEVPNSEWQIGHLDPTTNDNSQTNLTFQPPIQARYRDRFKWCPLFMKMWPTGDELVSKFNKYYTEQEQRHIYASLRTKFESS